MHIAPLRASSRESHPHPQTLDRDTGTVSLGKRMSKHDAGDAATGNGDGEQAAVFVPEKGGDPGLEFLREINLSPSEEEEYANLARSWIPGAPRWAILSTHHALEGGGRWGWKATAGRSFIG